MVGSRDEAFMRAALALASRGLGQTAPNPSVAALVVDEHVDPPRMLARGVTSPGGRPHAEANALIAAGEAARGATMFVTLEPCATRSSTSFGLSCSEMILASGIARVVIGAADPSPHAAGGGAKALRAAGIAVDEGVLAGEAAWLNRGHALRITAHRPFVRIKLAETADGFAAYADGRPMAITGEAAHVHVHRMRGDVDAILTGANTVLNDDPRLDVRLPGLAARSPLRVVLDSAGRLPAERRIFADAARIPVVIATADPVASLAAVGEQSGLERLAVPVAPGGLDLVALMSALAARGMTRVMVEAGPKLAEAFFAAGLWDEIALFTAPAAAGQGLPARGATLGAFLATARPATDSLVGPDRLRIYQRRG